MHRDAGPPAPTHIGPKLGPTSSVNDRVMPAGRRPAPRSHAQEHLTTASADLGVKGFPTGARYRYHNQIVSTSPALSLGIGLASC
jgi:hypothetical protein